MNGQVVAENPVKVQGTAPAGKGILQRTCSKCGETDHERMNGIPERSAVRGGTVNVPPIVREVLREQGQPLDAMSRAFFESRFGYDFSRVRVHTGTRAAESARAVDAFAYTVGRDIVFGHDGYRVGSHEGRRLIMHELSHVVQQQALQYSGEPLEVGPVNANSEYEADRMAEQAEKSAASGLNHTIHELSPDGAAGGISSVHPPADGSGNERFFRVSKDSRLSLARRPCLHVYNCGQYRNMTDCKMSHRCGTGGWCNWNPDLEPSCCCFGSQTVVPEQMQGESPPESQQEARASSGGLIPTRIRPLDPAVEIPMARSVYGSSLVYHKVLLSDATGAENRPYTLHTGNKNTMIQIGPSAFATPGSNHDLLIHELAHSWQCQHGSSGYEYILNSIASQVLGGAGAYCYIPGRPFGAYGAEQVAQQAEDGVPAVVSHMSSIPPLVPDRANIIGLSVPHWERAGDPGVHCP